MILPRYWAKSEASAAAPDGRSIPFAVWRWSERSLDEARASAAEAAARVAARIGAGEPFPPRYAYADRPVREEVVRAHEDADGAVSFALTRNTYGALVLNAARVMFLDLDLPEPAAPSTSTFGRLFGRKQAPPESDDGGALDRLRAWIAEAPERGARVYRTRAGYRYLVTHDLFEPTGAEEHAMMEELGVDEKYRALCRAQKSFRARLTPKPWRIGYPNPGPRFPYDEVEAATMRDWSAGYAAASEPYAVCELLETIGSGDAHPDVARVIALHDDITRVGSGRPLA